MSLPAIDLALLFGAVAELLRQPWFLPMVGGVVLMSFVYSEFVKTAEISGSRIIIKLFALRQNDEVRFSDIVSMRLARGPFDDFIFGERIGAAFFARRLIIKLSSRRWFYKTLYLKARNAREILAAFNGSRGLP